MPPPPFRCLHAPVRAVLAFNAGRERTAMLAKHSYFVLAELSCEFLVGAPRQRPQQFGHVTFHIAQIAQLPVRHPRMIELAALEMKHGKCRNEERVVFQPELLQVG